MLTGKEENLAGLTATASTLPVSEISLPPGSEQINVTAELRRGLRGHCSNSSERTVAWLRVRAVQEGRAGEHLEVC